MDDIISKVYDHAPFAYALLKRKNDDEGVCVDFSFSHVNTQLKQILRPSLRNSLHSSTLKSIASVASASFTDFFALAKEALETGKQTSATTHVYPQNKDFQLVFQPLDSDNVVIYGIDITASVRAESLKQMLDTQEARLRAALNATPDLVTIKNTEHQFVMVNDALRNRYAHLDQIEGRSIWDVYPHREAEWAQKMDDDVIQNKEVSRKKMDLWGPDGSSTADITRAPIIHEGEVIGIISIGRDISEEERMRDELEQRNNELETLSHQFKRLSYQDDLTGIYNRRRFYEDIKTVKSQKGARIIMLDLNNFKLINDTYGHYYGDKTLRALSQKMESLLGNKGNVYRIGGDEFAVLTTDATNLNIETFIATLDTFLNDYGPTLTVAYAAMHFNDFMDVAEDSETFIETVLRHVDKKLYKNKKG